MMVDAAEAAALVGVRPCTIRQWCRRGHLRAAGRWGRRHLFDPLAVVEAERAARVGSTSRGAVDRRSADVSHLRR